MTVYPATTRVTKKIRASRRNHGPLVLGVLCSLTSKHACLIEFEKYPRSANANATSSISVMNPNASVGTLKGYQKKLRRKR